jgi:hypothetical protein
LKTIASIIAFPHDLRLQASHLLLIDAVNSINLVHKRQPPFTCLAKIPIFLRDMLPSIVLLHLARKAAPNSEKHPSK